MIGDNEETMHALNCLGETYTPEVMHDFLDRLSRSCQYHWGRDGHIHFPLSVGETAFRKTIVDAGRRFLLAHHIVNCHGCELLFCRQARWEQKFCPDEAIKIADDLENLPASMSDSVSLWSVIFTIAKHFRAGRYAWAAFVWNDVYREGCKVPTIPPHIKETSGFKKVEKKMAEIFTR